MVSYIAIFHFNNFWICPLLYKLISSLVMHVINAKTHLGGQKHFNIPLTSHPRQQENMVTWEGDGKAAVLIGFFVSLVGHIKKEEMLEGNERNYNNGSK